MHRTFKLLAASAVVFLGAGVASAQQPYGIPGGCGYGGFWGQYGIYGGGNSLPYFSLFPPVYYSVPVPRTYGYSPFAYPAGVMTPEVTVTPLPGKLMVNPHVGPRKPEPTVDQTTGGPLLYTNPFVKAALGETSVEVASTRK